MQRTERQHSKKETNCNDLESSAASNNQEIKRYRSSSLLFNDTCKVHISSFSSLSSDLSDSTRRASISSNDSTGSFRFLNRLALSPRASLSGSTAFTSDINAWVIPYKESESNTAISVQAYVTKLPPSYYNHASHLSISLKITIATRLANNAKIPVQRRLSLEDDTTHEKLATGKCPPIQTKTNTCENGGFMMGHIPRRKKLQQKTACPLDNNIRGGLPINLSPSAFNHELTEWLKKTESRDIIAAYNFHNYVCWEERVDEIARDGDHYIETGNKIPKSMIQEAYHIYWILDKIKFDQERYRFLNASTHDLHFLFDNDEFKIDLNILMPHTALPSMEYRELTSLQEFAQHVEDLHLLSHHAALFYKNASGEFVPDMVWCGIHGHITGDADVQFFGKRFDMPRIAYAIFEANNPDDHIKFRNGLLLLKERITCASKAEFVQYVNNCGFDVLDYISAEEYNSDNYLNYADPTNVERYKYYHETFMSMLKATINHYTNHPEGLKIVCTSDLYSLILQVAFNDPLSIHAPEDTNLHPGEVGAILLTDQDNFTATENEASLLAALFADKDLLKTQVISMNPYYLRDRGTNDALSKQWLDVIIVRCLHAAEISDFEFRMHWITINRTFAHDKVYGPCANAKVDAALQQIAYVLQQTDKLSAINRKIKRADIIESKLKDIYDSYADITKALEDSLEHNARLSSLLDLESPTFSRNQEGSFSGLNFTI